MLVLTQGEEIPVLKRALPVFEEILTKKNLCLVPPNSLSQAPTQSQAQDNSTSDAHDSSHIQVSPSYPSEQWERNPMFDVNFLGFDSDDWQIGEFDFTGQC